MFNIHTSRDYDLVADSIQKARISIDGYAGTVEVLKYNLQGRAMLVLWRNGQLSAICEPSRILELQDRLKGWLQKSRNVMIKGEDT